MYAHPPHTPFPRPCFQDLSSDRFSAMECDGRHVAVIAEDWSLSHHPDGTGWHAYQDDNMQQGSSNHTLRFCST